MVFFWIYLWIYIRVCISYSISYSIYIYILNIVWIYAILADFTSIHDDLWIYDDL